MDPVSAVAIGFSIFSGLFGIGSSISASRRQEELMREANAINAQKLAFAKEIYANWQKTYGTINTQLGQHYANLTAQNLISSYEKAGIAQNNTVLKQLENTRRQLQQQFQQQGLKDSGINIAANMQLEARGMEAQAAINHDTTMRKLGAEKEVMADKAGFYQMGLQEKQMAIDAMTGAQNSRLQTVGAGLQLAEQRRAEGMNMLASGITQLGTTLGYMSEKNGWGQQAPTPAPTFNQTSYNKQANTLGLGNNGVNFNTPSYNNKALKMGLKKWR